MRGNTLTAAMATAVRAFSSATPTTAGGVSMVQGALRGIGLEFVRQLLRRSDQGHVVTTCRAPGSAAELQELRREHARRLTVLPLDVTDESTIEAAAAAVGETHGSSTGTAGRHLHRNVAGRSEERNQVQRRSVPDVEDVNFKL